MQEEIFADGIGSIVFEGGVMRIDLMSRIPGNQDKDGKPQMVFRQRVIMPVEGFLDSYKIFQEIIGKMEHSGLITRRSIAPLQESENKPASAEKPAPADQV